ncbi:MAG: flavodoxin [Candidatus Cloacimonadota bacterium]|nr:MAG: flavodoxin [Candidatus Cloacimonadota bacterium]PIE79251.1 MAG: flavodoxin [Candidatus Delongbacteria bacterium]
MKTLIAYSSKSGNTKMVAEAIHELDKENLDISDIRDIKDVEGYERVVVGFWIDKGTANQEALKFIETLEGKDVAFFFTLGAKADSDHAKDCVKACTELFSKNRLIGHSHCQGRIDPKFIEWMKTLPLDHPHGPNEASLKRWEAAAPHPTEDDIKGIKSDFSKILAL